MRTRRLITVCMAALMTLTAATGAYALACSQCHETGQGGQEYAPNGHGHYYRAQRGCCHGRWRTDCVQAAPGCTYGHGACRGYYCDSRHACFNGCPVSRRRHLQAGGRRLRQGCRRRVLQRAAYGGRTRTVVQVYWARGGARQAPHLHRRCASRVNHPTTARRAGGCCRNAGPACFCGFI